MRRLLEIGNDPELAEFVFSRFPPEIVRGIHVTYDDYWLISYARKYDDWHRRAYWPDTFLRSNDYVLRRLKQAGHKFDLDWRPDDWGQYSKSVGLSDGEQPIRIKLILRDDRFPQAKAYLSEGSFGPLHWRDFRVDIERRPLPVAVVSPPSIQDKARNLKLGGTIGPIGSKFTGTAGGVLLDSSCGETAILTCGHVLPHKADFICPGGKQFWIERLFAFGRRLSGTTFYSSIPTALGDPPFHPLGHKCDDQVDVAIAYPEQPIAVSPEIHRVTPVDDMTKFDAVFFAGASSGHVEACIGNAIAFDTIKLDGKERRFRNMVELRPQEHRYLNSPLVRGGDSGAWAVSDDNGLKGWDAVIVAQDGPYAVASFAELTLRDVRSVFPALSLLA